MAQEKSQAHLIRSSLMRPAGNGSQALEVVLMSGNIDLQDQAACPLGAGSSEGSQAGRRRVQAAVQNRLLGALIETAHAQGDRTETPINEFQGLRL
jgi:hypothetical protein